MSRAIRFIGALLLILFAGFFCAPATADSVSPSYSQPIAADLLIVNGCTSCSGTPVFQDHTCLSTDPCDALMRASGAGVCYVLDPASKSAVGVGWEINWPWGYLICYGTNPPGGRATGMVGRVTSKPAYGCPNGGTLVNNDSQCAVCPSATPAYTYNPDTKMCERPDACVYPSVNSISGCVCNAPNYLVNGVCTEPVFCVPPQVPVNGVCQYVCPVDSLPKPPPPFDDACSQALEDHGGKLPDPSVCQNFDQAYNDKLASCVAGKVKDALGNNYSYNGPTATYRTDAYQQHLYDIWARAVQLDLIKMFASPEIAQACVDSQVNKDVQEAIRHHGVLIYPIKTAGSHGESRAIDISRKDVEALEKKVTIYKDTVITYKGVQRTVKTVVFDIQDYMNALSLWTLSPCFNVPAIEWGGKFRHVDRVHFQFKQ